MFSYESSRLHKYWIFWSLWFDVTLSCNLARFKHSAQLHYLQVVVRCTVNTFHIPFEIPSVCARRPLSLKTEETFEKTLATRPEE